MEEAKTQPIPETHNSEKKSSPQLVPRIEGIPSKISGSPSDSRLSKNSKHFSKAISKVSKSKQRKHLKGSYTTSGKFKGTNHLAPDSHKLPNISKSTQKIVHKFLPKTAAEYFSPRNSNPRVKLVLPLQPQSSWRKEINQRMRIQDARRRRESEIKERTKKMKKKLKVSKTCKNNLTSQKVIIKRLSDKINLFSFLSIFSFFVYFFSPNFPRPTSSLMWTLSK